MRGCVTVSYPSLLALEHLCGHVVDQLARNKLHAEQNVLQNDENDQALVPATAKQRHDDGSRGRDQRSVGGEHTEWQLWGASCAGLLRKWPWPWKWRSLECVCVCVVAELHRPPRPAPPAPRPQPPPRKIGKCHPLGVDAEEGGLGREDDDTEVAEHCSVANDLEKHEP